MVKNEWGVVTVDLGIKAWAVAGMLIADQAKINEKSSLKESNRENAKILE